MIVMVLRKREEEKQAEAGETKIKCFTVLVGEFK
jgi:hypothetical protein